jgi:predicted nucleotide-binding protein
MADDANATKQTKVSQADLPALNLASARRVAEGLHDQFAGKSAAPHDLALALNISPTSSSWRVLTGAAVAYGLTQGGYNAQEISLGELGRRIVAPTEEGEDDRALAEAALKPRVLREFFTKYDRAKFPRDDIAKNVLASFSVPKDRLDKALEIVKDNGRLIGAIRDTKTGPFVALSGNGAASNRAALEERAEEAEPDVPDLSATVSAAAAGTPIVPRPAAPKQIFVAHGKNHEPLEDLKKILDRFKIPYKVAVDEPNVGRPISAKVAQLMRECSAGIFIFTSDERFEDSGGNEIHRPSENVVYELGAASVLWENKIIILKQKDVTFPSDYKDLGYIEFEQDRLAVHALDLLNELIALEFVRVQAA